MPKRTDTNQKEIHDALEATGCVVFNTSQQGHGFPDLVVITPAGCVWLVEIKVPEGRFTDPRSVLC